MALSSDGIEPCPRCGRPVRITVTAAGKNLAVDAEPDATGNTAVYQDGAGRWRSRRPTDEYPLLPYEALMMPHPATCPAPAPRAPGRGRHRSPGRYQPWRRRP